MERKNDGTFAKLTPAVIQQRVGRCGDFSYIGGYTGTEGRVDLKCNVCGAEFSRSFIGIRHGKRIACKSCQEIRRLEKAEETRAAKAVEREARRRARAEAERERHRIVICRECGEAFDTTNSRAAFCCATCRKRYWNRTKDNKSRYTKNGKADYTISLEKLYARDGGICRRCGKALTFECPPNANEYPSIDHIRPISKGGLHQWDNVQLLCRYCNLTKRDS